MKKILSFFAAMLFAVAVFADTDFAAPGYACAADDAVLTGGSGNLTLNTELDPHQIQWSDVGLSSNALATWTITATRGCYVTASLDLGPVIASNKHIFEVKILDDKSNVKGTLAEPKENADADQVKVLEGTILLPKAGVYTVELRNNRDWGKGRIKNVILTYAADAPSEIVEVTKVELNKTELALDLEEVELLKATVSPDNATDPSVTWETSNAEVATVNENGLVTAIAAGNATITAKAGEKSATCAVTVAAAAVPDVDFAEPYVLAGKVAHLEGAIWKNEAYKLYGDGGHNKNYGSALWTINVTKPCIVSAMLNGVEGGHLFELDLYKGEELVATLAQPDGKTWSAGEIALEGTLTFAAKGNYTLKLRNTQEWSSGKVASITLTSVIDLSHTYTVAGSSAELFGEAWKPEKTENDMALQNDGTYKWEKTDLTLAAGTIEFKVVVDHNWDNGAYPGSNYQLQIAEAGIYTITITFEPANENKVDAVATKTGSAEVLPTVAMHGNFLGSWADTQNFTVADDQKTASLKLTIAAGNYEFGMRIGGSGNWTSNGAAFSRENNSAKIVAGQGNLTLAADAAGDYIFTWTYETETLAITFPEAAPVVLDAPDAAPADPTSEAYQVKAVYSKKYEADCNFGEWDSGTQYKQEEFGKKYVTTEKGYFGLEFAHTDCSEMEKLHLDAWIAADASIRVVPIHGGTEVGVTVELKGQQWNSIDIDLSKFEGVTNWSNVYQIKIDNAANLTFWLNNVYFYTTQTKTIDLVDGYYLIGTMNSWDLHNVTAADKFAVNPANEKEYVLTTALAENDEFKVVEVANNAIVTGKWFPAEAGNYVVDFAHAGENKDIYFRPDGEGGEGWHAGCIYVAENVNTNPWETTFHNVGWTADTESTLAWDEETGKATITIASDKNEQWQAQAKYHGLAAQAGKFYNVSLKLKANNAVNGVTVKYQDNAEMFIENASVVLEQNVEKVISKTKLAGKDGNGILVLDFGFAKAGDIIEIYDVVIEETEAPEPVLADGFYLIGKIGGVEGWDVAALKAENKFEQNPENNAEYMLNVTLAEGDQLQVVNVINDKISGDWFPGGEGNNYIVDADHAGEVTIYFRPDREGGDDWWKGCIYVDAKDEPVADCDWDNLSWIADGSPEQTFGDQFKVCVGNPAPKSIVNIQKPVWAAESGIYMSFPSAAFGEISLPEGKYAIDGAGMVLYVSAFVNKLTDVTIVCDGNTYAFTVYNDKGKDASAIESNTIAPKTVKLIENGQLYIILNGVRYNALGQME